MKENINYTREELLDIASQAMSVSIEEWDNRDSYCAIGNVVEIYCYLKSGAKYHISKDSNDETIWIYFDIDSKELFDKAFDIFINTNDYQTIDEFREKYGYDIEMFDYNFTITDEYKESNHYGGYLPTIKRLNDREGYHWY